MWGWGDVQSKLIVSTRHCTSCEVAWSGDTKCWSCGAFGDSGGVPFTAVVEPLNGWPRYDAPNGIEHPWTIAREL